MESLLSHLFSDNLLWYTGCVLFRNKIFQVEKKKFHCKIKVLLSFKDATISFDTNIFNHEKTKSTQNTQISKKKIIQIFTCHWGLSRSS